MLICSQSYNLSYMKQTLLGNGYRLVQAPVVEKVNSGIHRINQYTVDNTIGFVNTYPLDSDLSGGSRYPPFEQPRWDLCYRFIVNIQVSLSEGTLVYFASYLARSLRQSPIEIYLAALYNLYIASVNSNPLQGRLLLKTILRGILHYQRSPRIRDRRQSVNPGFC